MNVDGNVIGTLQENNFFDFFLSCSFELEHLPNKGQTNFAPIAREHENLEENPVKRFI